MKPPNAERLRAELCKINEVKGACAIHHRHLKKVLGGLVGVRVVNEQGVAVAWGMISRPVSRHLQARNWIEFTRGIVPEGAPPNCASLLLAFAAQWARKQRLPGDGKKPSGRPICTYTLGHEPGTSLVAAGWVQVGNTEARATWQSSDRARETRTGVLAEPKRRWVANYCVDIALSEGFPLSPEPRSDVMYPEQIALHTAPGRAIHLQKNVRIEYLYEVVDSGVGTARFTNLAPAEAFFAHLKGEPVAKPKTDAPPLPLIAAIPGVHLYYDYGRWHIALRSRLDEDRLVYCTPSPGVVPDGASFTPNMACFSTIEAKRRGLGTWSEGVWAAGAKFIFPAIPDPGKGADNLNYWGTTDFTPYAEVTLAHNLGLVEAIDADEAPHPGVRVARLRGGVTVFVRRSTPLATARSANGAWRLWLGDGEGWRSASGPNVDMWKAVEPFSFGEPVAKLAEFLPGAAAGGVGWEMIASSGEVIPAAADAVGDILMMANIAGDILCFVDDDIPDEDDREAFDAWTIFTAA